MLQKTFFTTNDWTGFILRMTLGLVLFPHGAQKMLGWFDGLGFAMTMEFFTELMHLPWLIGFLVIVIEFFGSLSLILGFASRLWSVAIIGLFIGIIFTSHIQYGFFMYSQKNPNVGGGFEFHLLVIGIAMAILVNGSGIFSLDKAMGRKRDVKYNM